MCGAGFGITRKQAAVIVTGAVVLSPLLLVGAAGWYTVKGIAAGVELLKKHNGKRFRDGARQFIKGLRHHIGRAELGKAIADLDAKIQASSVEEPRNVSGLVLKGKILSFLDRFEEADECFQRALAPEESAQSAEGLPTNFNRDDVLMSISANRLRQIAKVENFISADTVALIGKAADALQRCSKSITDVYSYTKPEERAVWCWMAGAAKYYTFCQDDSKYQILRDVIADLESSLFITDTPDVSSLLSQCHRLRGDDFHADALLDAARKSDPNVFIADYTDRKAMLVPWPVRNILPDGAEVREHHEFTQKTFHRPTYCDFCNKFVHGSWFREDAECTHCSMRVHAECKAQVQGKCVASAKPHGK